MRSVIISSNSSGGGKTTITLALMKALKKRGYSVQGYKVGPDYIDPAFHKRVTGVASRNLDLFLMGEEGVAESYTRGKGELGVIEGVMGLYDGKGIDSSYSTAHVSKVLKLPVILVLSPKAQAATLCAELKGLMEYENIDIRGVILNNIGEGYYKLLKLCVEKNCNTKVFGYVPKDERLSLKSRHLGLVQSSEVEDLEEKLELCSELLEEYVDIDEILKVFKESNLKPSENKFLVENKGLRIAVAYDRAFSFYYKENIELLESIGKVQYFSPLEDKSLPENIDFLYIGGGYPEVFKEELGANKTMLKSIKDALDNGLKCYAECGGLMYLTESIEDIEMVGFFKGKSYMTKGLNNFGYAAIEVEKENVMITTGTKINCHEFHKSLVELEETKVYALEKQVYDGSKKQWNCGYVKKNTLAAYGHVHFFSNMEFLKNLVK